MEAPERIYTTAGNLYNVMSSGEVETQRGYFEGEIEYIRAEAFPSTKIPAISTGNAQHGTPDYASLKAVEEMETKIAALKAALAMTLGDSNGISDCDRLALIRSISLNALEQTADTEAEREYWKKRSGHDKA